MPDPTNRRRWTFGELYAEAERIAQALLGRFQPGEHVAVWAPNSANWVLVEFGMALAGLTLVTVNPAFRPRELRHVLGQSRSAGVFLVREYRRNPMLDTLDSVRPTLPQLREVVLLEDLDSFAASGLESQALPQVRPNQAAQLHYTSGTTGFPKGALLSHEGIANNTRLLSERLGVAEGSVWLNQMPMFHTAGCGLSTLGPLQRLATQVCASGFEPSLTLSLIESERVTVTGGVPTMWLSVMENPAFPRTDLSSLQIVSSGGAKVPSDLVRQLEQELGVQYATMFGQTEAAPGICMSHLNDSEIDKAETVGTALPWTEIKIVDPATEEKLASNSIGEMRVRSPMLMAGYYDSPEATAAALDSEGWLHTGDLCSVDERGYVRVFGRVNDMINRGGENIHPAEIEEVLRAHRAVADVAVVGTPDSTWGEQVAAFVCLADDQSADGNSLSSWVRQHLASYKTPRHWSFVEELPMTASGKVQKYVLREQLANVHPAHRSMGSDSTEVTTRCDSVNEWPGGA